MTPRSSALLFALSLAICANSACTSAPRTPSPEASKSSPSRPPDITLSYDRERELAFALKIAHMMRHMYGLEHPPSVKIITPDRALATIRAHDSMESLPAGHAAYFEELLTYPDALVYALSFDTFDNAPAGLPHSIFYLPFPLIQDVSGELVHSERDGVVLVNTTSSSVARKPHALERDELERLLQKGERTLLLLGASCGAYDALLASGTLDDVEHVTTMFDEDMAYWSKLLGTSTITFPMLVLFEDGKAKDAHHGFGASGKASIESFLSRHGISKGSTHHTTIDPQFVSERFGSQEAFAQWVTAHKSNLSGIIFEDISLENVNLYHCSLNGSILRRVDLTGADMRGCDLRCARFEESDPGVARLDEHVARGECEPEETSHSTVTSP